jgi:hypothetical protein
MVRRASQRIGLAHVAAVLMDMPLNPNLSNRAATDVGV